MTVAIFGMAMTRAGRCLWPAEELDRVFQWGVLAGMNWTLHDNVANWLDECLNRPANRKVRQMAKADMAAMNG